MTVSPSCLYPNLCKFQVGDLVSMGTIPPPPSGCCSGDQLQRRRRRMHQPPPQCEAASGRRRTWHLSERYSNSWKIGCCLSRFEFNAMLSHLSEIGQSVVPNEDNRDMKRTQEFSVFMLFSRVAGVVFSAACPIFV